MSTRETLLSQVEEFLTGKRKTCFSEVEGLLNSFKHYLLTESPTASADAPASAPQKYQFEEYHVEVTLAGDFIASDEDAAWEAAMDAISTRKGMALCGHRIEKM